MKNRIPLLLAILFAAGLNSSRAQDTWVQKADFGGIARGAAVGFSIGSKGYIGTGNDINGNKKDFWEYDPATDAWTQKADFGGLARTAATGFSIESKGYIGLGGYYDSGWHLYNDFWEYDPSSNAWTQKANFVTGRQLAAGFSIGNKGYMGIGGGGGNYPYFFYNDFWEYDPATDVWTQKTDFGGTARGAAAEFSIGSKGYIGTGGANGIDKKDFWEYDPSTNAWIQKADFGGTGRATARGFSIGGKGYIGTGTDEIILYKDFWEYDPSANTWTKKADFGGTARDFVVALSIDDKGYIGIGYDGSSSKKDFWEYTPGTNTCAVPTNLSVTNITSSSAKLNWDAVAGAEGYKVRYKVSGNNPWTLKNAIGNSKTLQNLTPNTKYTWEVKTYCTIAPGTSSEWSAKQHFTTALLRMGDESFQQTSFQIYPNPVEDHATIQFNLPQSSHVYIKVYDVSGKEIGVLLDGELQQGQNSLQLNTNQFPKGVYMVRVISPAILWDGMENQKLIVK